MLALKRRLPEFQIARSVMIYGGAFLILLLIFTWHLSGQTPGFSPAEAATRSAAKLSNIVHGALFAPYKIVENILFHVSGGRIFFLRLTSVFFALFYCGCFFYVLKAWFGKPIAALATVLLAVTPLFLLASRTATPAIMFASPAAVMFSYSYLKREESNFAWLVFITIIAVSLYVPGMVWLILVAFISRLRQIAELLRENSILFNLGLIVYFMAALSPLAYSAATDSAVLRQWLLIPAQIPTAAQFGKDLLWAFASFFVKLRSHIDLSLSRLPILDAAQIGLFIFGTYVMWSRLRRDFLWLAFTIILGCILSALYGNTDILILTLPSVALICGMGLRYLFVEWRQIFPRNPLAKSFAIGLMSALILIHVLYGIRYSLLAWPSSSETRQAYVLK
jgi:hypothetical protein